MNSSGSRLRARPVDGAPRAPPAGCTALALADGRDGLLHVPVAATSKPCPLVVALHGAGSAASAAIMLFGDLSETNGLVLLAGHLVPRTQARHAVQWMLAEA